MNGTLLARRVCAARRTALGLVLLAASGMFSAAHALRCPPQSVPTDAEFEKIFNGAPVIFSGRVERTDNIRTQSAKLMLVYRVAVARVWKGNVGAMTSIMDSLRMECVMYVPGKFTIFIGQQSADGIVAACKPACDAPAFESALSIFLSTKPSSHPGARLNNPRRPNPSSAPPTQ